MKPKSTLRAFLLLAGSSLMAISSASAQSQWTNTTTGTQQWNTATNWDTDPTVPNGAGVSANLSVNLGATQTVNLATPVTLGSLTYGDSTATFFAQTIQGSTLTFDNNGSGATLTQASAVNGGPGNITNNLVLNDNLAIVNQGTNVDRNNAMQLTGVVSGTGGITLNAGGGGAVYLTNAANTYSGGFTLNHSTAKVVAGTNSAAFGTGTLTINAGTVDTSTPGGATQLLVTKNSNVWNGNFTAAAMWNNNGDVTLGNNITVTTANNNYLALGGNITETGGARGLTFAGGGAGTVFTLAGTNNYTGGTTVNAGKVNFLRTASMPSTGNVTFATGTTLGIGLGGTGGWTSTGTGAGTLAGIFDGTNVGVGSGGVALTYGAQVGLDLFVTGSHSFAVISNLGSGNTNFTQSGIGSLTITGDNTYVGTTTLMGGGTLILDYDTTQASKLAGTSQNAFFGWNPNGQIPHQGYGGGTVTLKGGTAFTEGLGSATLYMGGTFITRDGGSSKLRLNGINRNTGSSISFADATIADTDRTNTNGIIGGYATLGNDWAINQTNAGDGAVVALAAYDGALATSGGVATENNTLAGSQTQSGTTAANTVKITSTGNDQVLNLDGNNLTITSTAAATIGGIMYAGGGNGVYEISNGRIASSANNQELIFAVNAGTLKVSAIIGAASNGNSAVTKSGAGTLEISSTNASNATMYVNQGVVRLANAAASGAASQFGGTGVYVQNGAALELTGGHSFTNGERIMITGSGVSNGGALRSVSGANTWRGLVDIGRGGARINNDDAVNGFTLTAGIATVAGGNVTFGGAGNTTVSTAGIYGAGGLTKDGDGTLTLSAVNSYIGNTTVSDGTLVVTGNISTSVLTTVESGATIAGNGGTVGALTIESGGFINPGSSPGILNSGNYSQAGTYNAEIQGTTPVTGYDQINVTGTVDITGGSLVAMFSGTGYIAGDLIFILLNDGTDSITGTYAGFAQGATVATHDDFNWRIYYDADSGTNSLTGGNDIVLFAEAIPEPSTALLGALGMLALLRRKR